jgi:hypothetical protein
MHCTVSTTTGGNGHASTCGMADTVFILVFIQMKSDMKRGNFEFLSPQDKMAYLKSHCVLLAKRKNDNFCYELYQAKTFYIELQVYQRYSISNRFFCFEDTYYLEPYLDIIDISCVTQ